MDQSLHPLALLNIHLLSRAEAGSICFLLCLYGLEHVRFQKQVLSVDNVFKTDWLEVMKILISVVLTHKDH